MLAGICYQFGLNKLIKIKKKQYTHLRMINSVKVLKGSSIMWHIFEQFGLTHSKIATEIFPQTLD